MVLAFLRWPPLGLIAAAIAGLIVPFYGPSGLNVSVVLIALLFGLWLVDMLVLQRTMRLVSTRAVWPLFSLLVVACLSFAFGQFNWFPFAVHAPLGAQLGGLAIIVLSAGAFLLVANQVREIGWLQKMTWVFLIVAAASVIFRSILPRFGLPTDGLFQPMGSLFYVFLVAMAFSQAAFNKDLHPGLRLALAGLVMVTFYVLIFQKFADKSGWIPSLVCIVAIISFRSWRTALLLVPFVALLAWYLLPGLVASDQYSVSTRFDALSIVIQLIKANPILGLGFANYYWYTPLIPIRGYAVSFNSHNNYVDIVAQTGLVGLVCFLWFVWEVGRLGWRLRSNVPAGFAQAYVYGALGGLVGMVVAGIFGDWFLPFFYNVGLIGFRSSILGWLFLGGLVSLEQMEISSRLKA